MKQPVEQLQKLVRKFSGVGYVPLDLPPFEPDDPDLWHRLYAKEAGNVLYKPTDESDFGVNYRKSTHFWGCVPFANEDDAEVMDPTQFFVTKRVHWELDFPKLWARIQEELPFDYVERVTLWNSRREVKGHKDKHWKIEREHHPLMKWPSEFRIEIYSENAGQTFRIRPNADGETGAGYMPVREDPMANCKLPDLCTNSWAFRNELMVHGTRYSGNNKHLLIVQGIFDVDKVEALLQRSVNTWSDYVVPAERQAFDQYLEQQ